MYNSGIVWDDFQSFFVVYTKAVRTAAGYNGTMCNFAVEYNINSLSVNICFILGDG